MLSPNVEVDDPAGAAPELEPESEATVVPGELEPLPVTGPFPWYPANGKVNPAFPPGRAPNLRCELVVLLALLLPGGGTVSKL